MNNLFELIVIVLLLGVMGQIYLSTRPRRQFETKQISMLVDTSVLMDGRVIDLARTGFLRGQIIVPKSVLAELQLLADGSDHAKRERARSGMDVVKQLQDELGESFQLLQDTSTALRNVDDQLIALAKTTSSAVLTLDYNLNKVAQVEGVKVLNINELANAIRMVHLPGDTVKIELVQKGQGADQGVGYLSDGTMVVVEHAKKQVGQTVEVEIIRSLQTDAGKMMFAKLPTSSQSKKHTSQQAPAKQPSNGRRPAKSATASVQPSAKKNESTNEKSRQLRGSRRETKPVEKPARQTPRRAKPKTSAQREADLIRLVENQ